MGVYRIKSEKFFLNSLYFGLATTMTAQFFAFKYLNKKLEELSFVSMVYFPLLQIMSCYPDVSVKIKLQIFWAEISCVIINGMYCWK